DPVVFNNTSTGATGYSWDFGDGNNSSLQNPSHIYSSANTYNVVLIVSNSFNCTDSIIQSVTVNNAPQVGFTSSGATSGCGSVNVSFINNTTGGSSNSYLWDFGDGNTSAATSPSYTYNVPGTYT